MDEFTLLLHCRNLPGTQWMDKSAVRLGIQKAKEVIEDVPAQGEEVLFSAMVRVRPLAPEGAVDFSGPFVQGKAGERFLYLCWGERQGQQWEGFRRAKVPFRLLSPALLAAALAAAKPVHAVINMTDAKGGPLCATVPEASIQWHV